METERKLVTIRTIDDIQPIPGADFIVLAKIDGWMVVVGLNDFKVGDQCYFFEIDSFIPESLFEYLPFLANNAITWNGKKGARIKTVKLRKQISQGLAVPLNTFNKFVSISSFRKDETADYASILGVEKWDRELAGGDGSKMVIGRHMGAFPSYVRKTDEERIQNLWHAISNERWDYSKDNTYEVTEKLDGSSCTVIWNEGVLRVCSRNFEIARDNFVKIPGKAKWHHKLARVLAHICDVKPFHEPEYIVKPLPPSDFWSVIERYNIANKIFIYEQKRAIILGNFAIQGEIVGPGFNKNHLGLTEKEFYVFNIWDIDKQTYVDAETRYAICDILGLKHVPVITDCVKFEFPDIQGAVNYAKGKSLVNPDKMREGLVFKCREKPNLSFKIINNDYLLKNDE